MNNNPLLSVCIPIYNRKEYLRKSLERFLLEKELFQNKVQLYISDNCSEDDLETICREYEKRGLSLEYHRNSENLNMDGNFANCFRQAKGKYILLLGSDDTPCPHFFQEILPVLEENNLGLLHLSSKHEKLKELTLYDDSDSFLIDVNYWITFISGNIVAAQFVENVPLDNYKGTFFTQVPVYLEAACNNKKNAILSGCFYEKENDGANNGGYNLFQVFVMNLYGIFESFIARGLLSNGAFEIIKKIEFKEFLAGWIVRILMLRSNKNFKSEGSWQILWNYYGHKPYAYFYTFYMLVRSVIVEILKPFINKIR